MKKILIVEDDPMLVEIYQKKFSQDGSFEVLTASSGSETEKKIFGEKPDLVLLDLVLPEQDGFEILEKVRKDKSLDGTKIIIFSNLSQPEDKEKAKNLGADDFFVKSDFTPQQVVEKVKKHFPDLGEKTKPETTKAAQGQEVISEKKEDAKTPIGSKRILFFEAEKVFLDMFGSELKKAGFEVDEASNEEAGMEKVKNNNYGAILINSLIKEEEMPNLVEEIKKSDKNNQVPIIIIEEREIDAGEKEQLINIGVTEIMDKRELIPSKLAKKIGEKINAIK